jgi:hypothetical protein
MPNNEGLITGQLYKRYASVEITPPGSDTITIINGIRMEFRCTRQKFAKPFSSLELTVTNLNSNTRNTLVVAGAEVVLKVGYVSAYGTIFKGKIITVDHVRKGPDWNTVIKCQDGSLEASSKHSAFTNNVKGTSKVDILKLLLGDLGLGNGNVDILQPPFTIQKGFDKKTNEPKYIPAQTTYLHGYSVSGNTFNAIINVAKSLGYAVSIQNGAPLFSVIDYPATTFSAYNLTPETGLLGSPESGSANTLPGTKKFGITKAKCLMIPQIAPDSIIQLQHNKDKGSGKYLNSGLYQVQKAVYHGDTAGNTWECEMELKPYG